MKPSAQMKLPAKVRWSPKGRFHHPGLTLIRERMIARRREEKKIGSAATPDGLG